jgi:quinoprotein relay system zinc metallohydrolase 2
MFEVLLTLCLAGEPAGCTTERHLGGATLAGCRAEAAALAAAATITAEAEPQAWPCVPAGTSPAFTVTEVAPGVFVHKGAQALAGPANRGDIADLGFVIGEDAVAVIDAGGSAAVARDLLAAIRTETDLPIRWLILTHMHPDHVLGAPVLVEAGATILGHAKLARALAARREVYLDSNAALIGPEFAGSGVPDSVEPVADRRELDLGGRRLILEARPTAHTDNDLTVLDRVTGTLFLGDLLFMGHLPALDGSIAGWLEAIDALLRHDVARVVPGHGPVAAAWPEAAEGMQGYLAQLAETVRQAIAGGVPIGEAGAAVGAGMTAGWLLAEEFHARNVIAAFKELEWE